MLLFSTIEYLRMLDLGLRAATVNAGARLLAREDWEGINRTVTTAAVYFVAIAAVCCAGIIAFREVAIHIFNIPPALQPEARTVTVVIAVTVSLRMAFTPIPSTLEAFQRFDLVNRAYISALVFRSTGSIAVLLLGYGLVEMACVVLIAQAGESLWNLVSVTRIVPSFRVSPRLVDLRALSALFGYARHSAVMSVANLASIQGPTTLLGFLRGPTEVAFFSLPYRLLMYITEAVAKVSDVTSSVTAGLDEARDTARVRRLAVLTNRHCFAMFVPLAIFLGLYSTPLLRVWISPQVASVSGPLIPVLLVGFLFGMAGQYNAGGILVGQGKHGLYAWAIVCEVVVYVAALIPLVPRYGAWVTACVVSVVMAGRGAYLAVFLCRMNGFPLWAYLSAVYSRAVLTGLPVLALGLALKMFVWPGRNWAELILAGATIAAAYFTAAFFSILDPDHRRTLLHRVRMLRDQHSAI